MKCEQANEYQTEHAAGTLHGELRTEFETHLASCARCREEAESLRALWTKLALLPKREPSTDMDARFYSMLQTYRQGLEVAKPKATLKQSVANWIGRLWPAQPAIQFVLTVLLFGIGLCVGKFGFSGGQGNRSVAASEASLTQLRSEVAGLKEQVVLALLEQRSASERLRGVEMTVRLSQPQEQVIAALLRTLEVDPNVNVRLAAVDALQTFAGQPGVRKALLDSLPREKSPLVQVGLIDLMVDLKEREVLPILKTLLENGALLDSVRRSAERGLRKLG
jgi:anti-sigma factor RsiW